MCSLVQKKIETEIEIQLVKNNWRMKEMHWQLPPTISDILFAKLHFLCLPITLARVSQGFKNPVFKFFSLHKGRKIVKSETFLNIRIFFPSLVVLVWWQPIGCHIWSQFYHGKHCLEGVVKTFRRILLLGFSHPLQCPSELGVIMTRMWWVR